MKTEVASPPQSPEQPSDAIWRGLIIDGRGISLEEAFWPRILSEDGSVVYGHYDATSDFLQDKGPVKYVKTMSEAKSCGRLSSPALDVKAQKAAGEYGADLVIQRLTPKK